MNAPIVIVNEMTDESMVADAKRVAIEAIRENFSEIMETPPMSSKNESELLIDAPLISAESCDFTWFSIEGSFNLR